MLMPLALIVQKLKCLFFPALEKADRSPTIGDGAVLLRGHQLARAVDRTQIAPAPSCLEGVPLYLYSSVLAGTTDDGATGN